MDDAKAGPAANKEQDPLYLGWLEWAHDTLGHDPVQAAAAATAAYDVIRAGAGINDAYEAGRSKWRSLQAVEAARSDSSPRAAGLRGRLVAWQAAGIVDHATVARIEAFEAAQPPDERSSSRISASEVVAYIGSVILLVGIGFLYGTQYATLGPPGRLVVIGLVVAAGLAAGELVRRMGATGATRRARSAGWAIAAVAAATWFAELFVDNHILTRPASYPYPGAPDDTSGAIMLAAAIGVVIGVGLLWRSGAGLVALATSALAFISAGAFDAFLQPSPVGWSAELPWLVAAATMAILSEAVAVGHERRWAREVLRFAVVVPPAFAALAFSYSSDAGDLEWFAGFLALAAFGLAWLRGSAGYAIAGGVALFVVVNEVGFRHFAQSVGFPVVLIASGITLFAVAGGLFRLLPQLRRSANQAS
jgi:hypothetical protein